MESTYVFVLSQMNEDYPMGIYSTMEKAEAAKLEYESVVLRGGLYGEPIYFIRKLEVK